jgi:elongator complex protein 1
LEGGDIVTVAEDELNQQNSAAHIEIVGSIDTGISAARWSPDEELLVVVTKDGNVIFMGSSFDPVTEIQMTAEDLAASKHVSVGWGKKETQFQGRGARALRDPTIPEQVDQGLPSTNEDGATTISWRGDGAFVAINAVQKDQRRTIRVYSREGELDSASEPVDGLESTISWRPAGNLIAGIQRLSDRVDVVFFERNGLRHGQFTLRSSEADVQAEDQIRLEWNSDSTVLAVMLKRHVQLWTTGNYHWYLKQEIPQSDDLSSLSWHSERPLHISLSSKSNLSTVEFIFHTAKGSCLPPHDNGSVAVIDGSTVKLTAFRTANVPPPMAQFEVNVSSSVVDVAFNTDDSTFAVLHQRGLDTFNWPQKNGRSIKPQSKSSNAHTQTGSDELVTYLAVACGQNGGFVVLKHQLPGGCLHSLVQEDGSSQDIPGTSEQSSLALGPLRDNEGVTAVSQDRRGKLYGLQSGSTMPLSAHFKSQLPWFEVVNIGESQVAFGLSRNGHLYANTRQLVKNCTSFVLTPRHLIFTTNNHFVKYVHLVEDVDGKFHNPSLISDTCADPLQSSMCLVMIPKSMNDAEVWSVDRVF